MRPSPPAIASDPTRARGVSRPLRALRFALVALSVACGDPSGPRAREREITLTPNLVGPWALHDSASYDWRDSAGVSHHLEASDSGAVVVTFMPPDGLFNPRGEFSATGAVVSASCRDAACPTMEVRSQPSYRVVFTPVGDQLVGGLLMGGLPLAGVTDSTIAWTITDVQSRDCQYFTLGFPAGATLTACRVVVNWRRTGPPG